MLIEEDELVIQVEDEVDESLLMIMEYQRAKCYGKISMTRDDDTSNLINMLIGIGS